MNLKKIAAIMLALALCLVSVCAFAEDDKDAYIAELEARVAELEAEVADKDAYIAELEHSLNSRNYVAEYDGGYVTVEDAMAEYSYVEYMYSLYGYTMDGYEDYIKEDIMITMVEDSIVQLKAAELGLSVPTPEQEAELRATADETLAMYIDTYRADFEAEGLTDEEVDQATLAFLAENGITADSLYQQELTYFAADNLYAYVVADVEITDEELRAVYDEYVAEDESYYSTSPYYYESAVMNGTAVYWHPEGYRNVKQILIMFDADQSARYDEITDRIYDLELEKAAAESHSDTGSGDIETTEAVRPVEDIDADLAAANADLDALYAEIMPTANEVLSLYNDGTPFNELAFLYSGDTGSLDQTTGELLTYVVSENSEMYDPAFVEASMSVTEIGGISEPTPGMYGLYIVCYDSDVTAGAVEYEAVKEDLYYAAYDEACMNVYDSQIAAWCEELNVVYYPENFR